MIPKGSDFWVKVGVALVAVDFILSLPNWALGIILILALGIKYATDRLRHEEHKSEHPPSSAPDRSDPR